jgi:hypothetical protein
VGKKLGNGELVFQNAQKLKINNIETWTDALLLINVFQIFECLLLVYHQKEDGNWRLITNYMYPCETVLINLLILNYIGRIFLVRQCLQ